MDLQMIVGLLAVLAVAGLAVYYFGFSGSASGDVLPDGGVSGDTELSLSSGVLAAGTEQGTYSMQWWMLVTDWATKYGQEKPVVSRATPTGHVNPQVVLHPTDNKLLVRVSYLPAEPSADKPAKDATQQAIEALIAQAKNAKQPIPTWLQAAQTIGDYETFECEIGNIPLQAWYSVSLSLQQRSLDVYLNGQLVKTCLLPGVPVGSAAQAVVGEKGGFAGKIAEMHFSTQPLTPADALAFYNKGLKGAAAGTAINPSSAGSWNPFKRYTVEFKFVDSSQGKVLADKTL